MSEPEFEFSLMFNRNRMVYAKSILYDAHHLSQTAALDKQWGQVINLYERAIELFKQANFSSGDLERRLGTVKAERARLRRERARVRQAR